MRSSNSTRIFALLDSPLTIQFRGLKIEGHAWAALVALAMVLALVKGGLNGVGSASVAVLTGTRSGPRAIERANNPPTKSERRERDWPKPGDGPALVDPIPDRDQLPPDRGVLGDELCTNRPKVLPLRHDARDAEP